MNKTAIKNFAVWARKELIEKSTQRAKIYGIEKDQEMTEMDTALNGQILTKNEKNARTVLIDKIKKDGFDQTIEEVAYTWFNRFIAIRFMEVNGYLPSHIRVFSSEDNEFEPQILSEAIHIELDGLDQSKVLDLYNAGNKEEELFSYLLITQCNALNQVLPGMFQKINDYTELLLPDGLLREGSVLDSMIKDIPEDDWKEQVQIIGWLYQYYISEQKDEVFAGLKQNVKISKENIPAATQLFTPDWIVRYMVENSLGKLWYEGHPNEELKTNWQYYLEEADQENEVEEKLKEIRKEYADLKPEQINCIDPCIGSGHIGVYLFDVLIQIYESQGYKRRDAVKLILENNIYGLDIDERARQLAYFSLMMKAREHDRRFLTRDYIPQPKVYVVEESNYLKTESNRHALDYFINGNKELKEAIESIINDMEDAKEYGSITIVKPVDFKFLYQRFDEIKAEEITLDRLMILDELLPIVELAEVLSSKYDVVVTNPPYMGSDSMNMKVKKYAMTYYPNAFYDMYAVFMKRSESWLKSNGHLAIITQNSYLYALSFEDFRKELLINFNIINAIHLGTRAFEEITGEVVQTIVAIFSNKTVNKKSKFIRLVEFEDKEKYFFIEKPYEIDCDLFNSLPNTAFAYSIGDVIKNLSINEKKIGDEFSSRAGIVTGKDKYFLRDWFEVNNKEINLEPINVSDKYTLFSKGGSFAKWYGNITYVIKMADLWTESKVTKSVRRGDKEAYFKPCIGWSYSGGGNKKDFSYLENCACGTGTPIILNSNEDKFYYTLGFLNTNIPQKFIEIFNPTLNTYISDISNLPFVYKENKLSIIKKITNECIEIAKQSWNMHETSWDFKGSPLLANKSDGLITSVYESYKTQVNERFTKLKENEEELNRIFIEIYGLEDELIPDVADKDITVAKIFDKKEDIDEGIKGNKYIMTREDVVKNYLSYFVGCLMGRYSLDVEGLAYAGGDFDLDKYSSFNVDVDGVLPLTDAQYFEEDIVETFIQFLKVTFGEEHLNENLNFIASELKGKQTDSARDKIRNYFLNDFYGDHCKMYQKLPIYWQYDSGKNNACKGLFYLHRYDKDTFARIRINYVFEIQDRYKQELARLETKIDGASASERVALQKEADALKKKILESQTFEEKIQHLADSYIAIDLDDGVAENYKIFKDVLTKIK